MAMTATSSCLSLVEGDGVNNHSIKYVDFTKTEDAIVKTFRELGEDRASIENLMIRDVDGSCQKRMLTHFALILTSLPAIKKVSFGDSHISNIGPVFVAIAKESFPALEFENCHISNDAAEDLRVLLDSGKIQELALQNCTFDNIKKGDSFEHGLPENQSLRALTYFVSTEPSRRFDDFFVLMLEHNKNLETFGLTINGDQPVPHAIFDAIETGQSLKCLRIHSQGASCITLPLVERIMLACCVTTSIKELDFSKCLFDEDAVLYLLKALSRKPIINTLRFAPLALTAETNDDFGEILSHMAKLKVHRLVMGHESQSFLADTVREIANAGFVQHLELLGYIIPSVLNAICESLSEDSLRTELIVNPKSGIKSCSTSRGSKDAGLVSITCSLEDNHFLNLAQKVERMQGLRKLTIGRNGAMESEFFSALAQSVKVNSTLCTLSLHGLPTPNAAIHDHLADIRRSLSINRVGGLRLMEHEGPVPIGLWTRVLSRSSCDPDGIFYVLLEKPDIVFAQKINVNDVSIVDGPNETYTRTKRARLG